MVTMPQFKNVIENKRKPIKQILDSALQERITANCAILKSVIKTVVICGQQNVALRGHRDDSKYYDKHNVGNFRALLDFRVDSGDHVLEEHFKTASRNATYRSKTIQNEIINCCGEIITASIIEEVKLSKFYLLSADEAQDCSNKEQMPLVLRYVDGGEIRERL